MCIVGRAAHATTVDCEALAVGMFNLFFVHSILQEIGPKKCNQESAIPPGTEKSSQLL